MTEKVLVTGGAGDVRRWSALPEQAYFRDFAFR